MAKYAKTAWNIPGVGTEESPSFPVTACWYCPLEASDLMSELYRVLSNKSENPRTHLGFGDHRYFLRVGSRPSKDCNPALLACAADGRCVGVNPAAPRGAGRGGARPPGTLIPRGSLSRAGGCVWIIQSSWDSASGLSQAWVDWLSLLPPPSVLTPTPTPCPRWLGPLW